MVLGHKKSQNLVLAFLKDGAPLCRVVEPQGQLENQSNLLEYNENPLVATKTYFLKWQKDKVDLAELAKKRWIDQMSYREIAKSMGITRGQVCWNLKKIENGENGNEKSH